MPEIRDILNSVRVPQFIKDEEIRRGDFQCGITGNLIHYTGGFTVVFPVKVGNQKWAFRCWHNDTGIDAPRMKVLSDAIAKSHLKYLCYFKYENVGIMVNGKPYPTSKMKWIEGHNINDYILEHRHEIDKMKKLAEDFLVMTRDLHSLHIAHGDLQHGNIMVNKQGEIFLVDYDSMYCPQMGNVPDTIKGKEDFQHPARKKNIKASEKLDYFSELVIYTSILAISEDSSLAEKYNIDDSLLFKSQDYADLENSSIYKDIIKLGGVFPLLMIFLKGYLSHNSLDDLEPMCVLLDKNLKEPEIALFEIVNGPKIIRGKEAEFSFDVHNVTGIEINGEEVTPSSTKFYTKLEKTGIYNIEMKVSNWSSSITKSIEVEVVEEPSISINHRNPLLRRGKNDHSVISWKAKNLQNLKLHIVKSDNVEDIAFEGNISFSPIETTLYNISGIALDGKTEFKKEFTVYVYDESRINFSADKLFAFTSIPITLSWHVEHAMKVMFENEVVEPIGSRTIKEGINYDHNFTLSVMDEFGVKKKTILVRLLPMPVVESLLIPMPDANVTINANVTMPSPLPSVKLLDEFSRISKLPKIEFNEINIPTINKIVQPNFDTPQPIRWWQFNKVYNYFKNKIKAQKYEGNR